MLSYLKSYYLNNKVFVLSFVFSVSCYTVYVLFRGFGWDGDSFISASQYQKLIGSDLYGIIDGGAHPKILCVLLFGIIYQVTSGFYFLTVLAILLNALMVAVIASWIYREKGIWLIALIGILINIPWTKIVVNCDNPAFSMPFIIFGLYYTSKDDFIKGAIFLTISSLFRTGAEFIIILILLKQLFNKNPKITIIFSIAFTISAIHTYWGYLLVYPSIELFWELTWKFITTPESIAKYQYSLNAFVPYLFSIIKQFFNKYSILFVIPSIIGTIKLFQKQNTLKLILLTPVASFILPVSSFIYGTSHTILETKHMEYAIIWPILSAFAIQYSVFDKINTKVRKILIITVISLVILFSAFTGKLKHGDYEAHVNGSGVIGWTSFPDIKHDVKSIFQSKNINILTAYKYLTFVILDVGKYASNIDMIKTESEVHYSTISQYDLIIIPNTWNVDSTIISKLGYSPMSDINNSYTYYVSTKRIPYN